jgi:hypothetical protein
MTTLFEVRQHKLDTFMESLDNVLDNNLTKKKLQYSFDFDREKPLCSLLKMMRAVPRNEAKPIWSYQWRSLDGMSADIKEPVV